MAELKETVKLAIQRVNNDHWLKVKTTDAFVQTSSYVYTSGGGVTEITVFVNQSSPEMVYALAQQLIDAANAMRNEVA